jgi:hypothetical protein
MTFKMKNGSPMKRNFGVGSSPMKQGSGIEYCPECGEVFEGEDAWNQMNAHIFNAHFGGGPGSGTPGYIPRNDPSGWEPGDPTGPSISKRDLDNLLQDL